MKKRRILTLLLAFCMVLTLMPTVAVAAGVNPSDYVTMEDGSPLPEGRITQSQSGTYTTFKFSSGNYKMINDAEINILLEEDAEVTIDLNGKTIVVHNNIVLSNKQKLTVTDSKNSGCFNARGDESVKIIAGTFNCKVHAAIIKNGTFNGDVSQSKSIDGGTFNGTVVCEVINGGTFNGTVQSKRISGGEFFDNASADIAVSGGIFHGTAPNIINSLKVEYMLSENDTEPYAVEVLAQNGVAKGPTTSTLAKGNVIEGEIVGWKAIDNDGNMTDFEIVEEENTAGGGAAANPDEAKEIQPTAEKYGKYIDNNSLKVYANIELQIPYTLKVAKGAGGTVEPPAMDFELELLNSDYTVLTEDGLSSNGVALDSDTINTDGEKEYKGYLSLTGTFDLLQNVLDSGLFVRQKAKEPVSCWNFADEVWYVGANKEEISIDGEVNINSLADVNQVHESVPATAESYTEGYIRGLGIYKTKANPEPEQGQEGMYRYEADFTAPAVEPPCMVFTNTYTEPTGGSGGHSYSTVYTVKFDSNGGTPVADKTLTSITGKVLEGVTAPTFEGKSFTGWTYEGAAVSDENSFYDLTKNFTTTTITLTAQWQDTEETPTGKEDSDDKPQAGKNDNEKDKPAKETSEVPKTGDSSNMTMWLALILAAGAGMTAITYNKRKNADK